MPYIFKLAAILVISYAISQASRHLVADFILRQTICSTIKRTNYLDHLTHLICVFNLSIDLSNSETNNQEHAEDLKRLDSFKSTLREKKEEYDELYKKVSYAIRVSSGTKTFDWLCKKKAAELLAAYEKLEETYNMTIVDYESFLPEFKKALEASKEAC